MKVTRLIVIVMALGLFAAPLAAEAQHAGKVWRIGVLGNSRTGPEIGGLQQGLRERGYVEGTNLLVEWRFAEGRADRLRGLADELVSSEVDLIVTVASAAAMAVKRATTTIPIVFTIVHDPIAIGLVDSLARPAGNATGFTTLAAELTGKRVGLLKEAVPALKAVAILTDCSESLQQAQIFRESQAAAARLKLGVSRVEVRNRDELEKAFAQIHKARARGVVLMPGYFIFENRARIAELATKSRLAVLGWQRALAESGALVSYGPNHFELGRSAADYVDKILKGVKPADLPVQEPTRFELVINMKTAKALGLTIPRSVLIRADEVIE